MRILLALAFPLGLYLVPTGAWGDILVLTNEARIEGNIIAQSRQSVSIETVNGIRKFPRATIRRIVFRPFDPEAARKKQAEARRKQQAVLKARAEARLKQEQAKRDEAERRAREAEMAERRSQHARSGSALWLDFLLPGRAQYRAGHRAYAALLIGGLGLSAGAAGFAGLQQDALAARHAELDSLVILLAAGVSDFGGSGLDYALSRQRDAAGVRNNTNQDVLRGSLHVLAGVYLWNAADLLLIPGPANTGLFMQFRPDGMGLAYEVRF